MESCRECYEFSMKANQKMIDPTEISLLLSLSTTTQHDERSQGSYRTYRTAPPYTEDATMRSKTSKRGGIVIETSRAPHPMCPNTRSCCCLMLLFNLGLLLICLGFVIVLQLNDPPFVWYVSRFRVTDTYLRNNNNKKKTSFYLMTR